MILHIDNINERLLHKNGATEIIADISITLTEQVLDMPRGKTQNDLIHYKARNA